MAMRGNSLLPSTVTKTLVCVDEFNNSDMSGRFYNLYMPGPINFSSIYEVIDIMEEFFEEISFPQAYCEDRTFTAKPKPTQRKQESEAHQYMPEDIFTNENGKKATFVIQVQFRQNATWQGTITWTEEKKMQRFRSTLEMIKLMDDAMGKDEKEQIAVWENN